MLFSLSAWENKQTNSLRVSVPPATWVYLLGAQDVNPRGARCWLESRVLFASGDGCGLAEKSHLVVSGLPARRAAANLQTNVFQQEKSILSVPVLSCSCRSQIAALARRLRAPAAPRQRHSLGRRLLCKPGAAGGVRVEARGSSASPCSVLQCALCSRVRQRSQPAPPRPRRSGLTAALQPSSCNPRPPRCLFVSCVFATAFVSSAKARHFSTNVC